jgi:muramoyltetrapeptide carboxypeptidase LdcA involved in peptidoglycan recycling
MNPLIIPQKLKLGDKIALVSLSWGGPGAFPYRYEVGKQRLIDLFDLEVIPTKHALKDPEWIYKNPQARAEDFMGAFCDSSIKGIISTIGGDDTIRLLSYVDYEKIRNNPKVFLGYSDTTVNHFMCLKAGLRSYYGPAVMTSFAQNVEMNPYTIEGIRRVLFSDEPIGEIPENVTGWSKQYLEWGDPKNQEIQLHYEPPYPRHFLGQNSLVRGRLIGGCVEVLQIINNTSLWPDISTWKDSILFLETSEEGMSPEHLMRFLRNLAAQNILENLNGILFSKPGGGRIKSTDFDSYTAVFDRVIKEYTLTKLAEVTNMDFGHSEPQCTLPYGALVDIDPTKKKVTLLESSVV